MTEKEPREIIARAAADFEWPHCGGADAETHVQGKKNFTFKLNLSNAILSALDEAGWTLTRKGVNGALDEAAREFILDAYRKAGGPTDKLREAFALYMENASPDYTERRNALKKENR